ncbi:hypothetical protein M885DRAFT_226614 [Pelagophyceae sp. CCMP2097]|nr:hypothetical protein M885DRAFT_226614 [Pelagophyceae sp. CCMP2097]
MGTVRRRPATRAPATHAGRGPAQDRRRVVQSGVATARAIVCVAQSPEQLRKLLPQRAPGARAAGRSGALPHVPRDAAPARVCRRPQFGAREALRRQCLQGCDFPLLLRDPALTGSGGQSDEAPFDQPLDRLRDLGGRAQRRGEPRPAPPRRRARVRVLGPAGPGVVALRGLRYRPEQSEHRAPRPHARRRFGIRAAGRCAS